MTKRKQNEPPRNDFAPDENEEILGFTSKPIASGPCISSFSFNDDIESENITVTNTNNDSPIESNNSTPNISSNNIATSENGTIVSNSHDHQ